MERIKTVPITVRVQPETKAIVERYAANGHSYGSFIDQAVKAFVKGK